MDDERCHGDTSTLGGRSRSHWTQRGEQVRAAEEDATRIPLRVDRRRVRFDHRQPARPSFPIESANGKTLWNYLQISDLVSLPATAHAVRGGRTASRATRFSRVELGNGSASRLGKEMDVCARPAPPPAEPPNATTLRISVTDRCNLKCAYCMPDRRLARTADAHPPPPPGGGAPGRIVGPPGAAAKGRN